MASPILLVAALGAGILSHVVYFHPGEHHLYVNLYIRFFFLSWLVGIVSYHALLAIARPSSSHEATSWLLAFFQWTQICFVYLTGLFLSLFTFRIFLNPLNRFPGPFSARVSRLLRCWRFRRGNMHEVITELHREYGQFVRLSPYDISITHPDAVHAVQWSGSPCTKGQPYDLQYPRRSLQSMRDKEQHAKRRRVWSQGFSDRAVRGYEIRIRRYQDKLINALLESKGAPVNMVDWAKFYGYDVMGELAWGKSFGMLDTGKTHPVVALLDKGAKPLSLLPPVWLFRVLVSIPGALNDWLKFVTFVEQSLLNRMKNKPEIPDIMETLLSPVRGKTPSTQDMDLLFGDAQLIVIAGGDTSATTIAAILYLLASNPQHIEKLREEIIPLMAGDEYPSSEKLAASNHLNGVINEALRLYPAVPTQMIRLAPPEGITIAGEYIPGGTHIWVPQYSIGRDENLYPYPESFIPERWYDESRGLVKDRAAFAPFAIGPYNCIGKPLALASIRVTISRIVATFDISFPEPPLSGGQVKEKPGKEFEEGMLDYFVMGLHELNLCFVRH